MPFDSLWPKRFTNFTSPKVGRAPASSAGMGVYRERTAVLNNVKMTTDTSREYVAIAAEAFAANCASLIRWLTVP